MRKFKERSLDVLTISRFRKERFLRELSEERFRDEVMRPLFLRLGLKDGRDLCGRHEEGKDSIFFGRDPFGVQVLYVVQTKKGNLNLSKKATTSVIEATTQLKTALQTKVVMISTKEKLLPDYTILCASGKINDNSRQHIVNEIQDPRIRFRDIDELPRRKQRGIKNFKFCHSALDAESSPVFWIPASAGMTNSPQAAGNTTRREFNTRDRPALSGILAWN